MVKNAKSSCTSACQWAESLHHEAIAGVHLLLQFCKSSQSAAHLKCEVGYGASSGVLLGLEAVYGGVLIRCRHTEAC